jgi:hypothetical protein
MLYGPAPEQVTVQPLPECVWLQFPGSVPEKVEAE